MPLSVDGNVFDRKEILAILKRVSFKAPNSLEKALGPYRFLYRFRRGLCREQPTLVNLALNGVQTEGFNFPHGECSAQELLQAWQSGMMLDLEAVEKMVSNSCHSTMVPPLRARPS